MRKDPIVEEVHRVRREMLDECGGDMKKLVERLRRHQRDHQDRVVRAADVRRLTGKTARKDKRR